MKYVSKIITLTQNCVHDHVSLSMCSEIYEFIH